MGTYSRWALIRGWALIRINTVVVCLYINFVFDAVAGVDVVVVLLSFFSFFFWLVYFVLISNIYL